MFWLIWRASGGERSLRNHCRVGGHGFISESKKWDEWLFALTARDFLPVVGGCVCGGSGPVFIPSFRKLETVYQQLKQKAGPNRIIMVEDTAYLSALSRKDEVHRDAALIRRYVEVREKEASLTGNSTGQVTFTLTASDS